MTRLKNKILFFALVLVLTTLGGVLFFSATTLLKDKEETLKEISAVLVPSVATSIEKDLLILKHEVTKSNAEVKNIDGLFFLAVHQGENTLLTMAKDSSFSPGPLPEELPGDQRILLQKTDNERLLRMIFVDDGKIHDVYFDTDRIAKNFEPNRSAKLLLMNCDREILLGEAEPLATSMEFDCKDESFAFQHVIVAQQNKEAVVALSPLPSFRDTVVVGVIPLAEAKLLAFLLFKEVWIFALVILFFAVALSIMISKRIAKPIEELSAATAQISQGQWRVNLKVKGHDEVSNLVGAFNNMGQELEKREISLKSTHMELMRTEKLATLGKFSAGMAHEMKNPLNAILNFAELLLRKAELTAELAKEPLDYIVQETKRVNRIITDLMSFSRQRPPNKESVDLCDIANHAYKLQKIEAEKRGVDFSFQSADNQVFASVDREQILQVLTNITANAMHAVENKTVKSVSLVVKPDPGGGVIVIEDSGDGISPENLDRIFEPFFTTKSIGKGTGLGLAICHGIIREHNGWIKVQSELGKGTTFKIFIPS